MAIDVAPTGPARWWDWGPLICGSASVLLLLGAWELVGRNPGSAIASVLPPPSRFLSTIVESQFRIGLGENSPTVYQSIVSTLFRVFAGMLVSFVAALIMGSLLSLSRVARWTFTPLLHLFAPIAPIAWVPMAIVLFGISNVTAIFVVFMGVNFLLTIATLAEIDRIPEQFQIVAANLGASRWQRLLHVTLPAVLPGVFTLLRVNFLSAWMAVLVAEMVGLRDGIGAILMMGRNLFNSELIVFGMLLIGVCGFVIDKFLGLIQTRLLSWKV